MTSNKKIISSKEIGKWDNDGRFTINPDYHINSSRMIRTPSRAYPFSEYKHIFTKKYCKQLSEKFGQDIEIVR